MKYDVCVVGLGYVGLTLAAAFANKGLRVLGLEKRTSIVDATNQGVPHFQEVGLPEVLDHVVETGKLVAKHRLDAEDHIDGAFVITVGTPLKETGEVNLDFIQSATRDILSHVKDGSLVVLRSTVQVGTCRNIVAPILDESGKAYELAMCPERTLEGKAMEELTRLPQIIGADSAVAMKKSEELFSTLTNAIIRVPSYEAAEITKLVDNTFRDVQFAFANEVARICEAYSVNAMDVIAGGKLGYPRTNVALPGLVGGPCLEKDPHIFEASARKMGISLEITKAARFVNERQPIETVSFIQWEAKSRGLPDELEIAILGLAFKGKPETDDLRGAMSVKVLAALEASFPHASFRFFDPVITRENIMQSFPSGMPYDSVRDVVRGAHIAIITNNHPRMATWAPNQLVETMAKGAFIYDYWNHFSTGFGKEAQGNYYAVGNIRS